MAGLSQAQYAAQRGVSRQYVNKLVKQRKLPTLPDGSIDAVAADVVLRAMADPSRQMGEAPDPRPAAVSDEFDDVHQAMPPAAVSGMSEFQRAKTVAAVLDARRKQMEFERSAGNLLWREDVAQATAAIVEKFRQDLAARAVQMAQQLAAAGDEAERLQMIEAADRAMLEALAVAFARIAAEAEADHAAA